MHLWDIGCPTPSHLSPSHSYSVKGSGSLMPQKLLLLGIKNSLNR